MERLYRITGQKFCAGFLADGLHVTRAAPILGWTVGKLVSTVLAYARGRGWQTEELRGDNISASEAMSQTISAKEQAAPSVSLFQVPQTSSAFAERGDSRGPSLPKRMQDSTRQQEVDSKPTRKGGE